MRRVLTLTLAVHWMCVFAMLGIACTVDPRDGFAAPLDLLGLDTSGIEQDGGSEVSAFFAVAFLLVATLFFVALANFLLGGSLQTRRRSDFACAFGAGALVLTLLVLASALQPVPYLFGTVETVLAAALASFLAMQAEPALRPTEEGGASAVARLMALGAAHSSLLTRISGRPAGGVAPRNT